MINLLVKYYKHSLTGGVDADCKASIDLFSLQCMHRFS